MSSLETIFPDISRIQIKSIAVSDYRIPFVKPMRIGSRILNYREGLIIHLMDEQGNDGYGEIAPLEGFSKETVQQARNQIQYLKGITPEVLRNNRLFPSVRFGIETALIELMEKRENRWLSEVFGNFPDREVAVNGLLHVPKEGIRDLKGEVEKLIHEGFKYIKIKVGRSSLESDIETIRDVTMHLPPGIMLRLDVNRLWDYETALKFGKAIDSQFIEYIEEPFVDIRQIPDFYSLTHIPVALDESLDNIDTQHIEIPSGVEAFVLKPSILGGIAITRQWIDYCKRKHLKPVISSCFEAGPGFRMLIKLAMSVDFIETAFGLDTLKYLNYQGWFFRESPPPGPPAKAFYNSNETFSEVQKPFFKRVSGKESFSFKKNDEHVSRLISFFLNLGIQKGKRVALVGQNSTEYVVALIAIWRIGAVAVPLNFRFPIENLKSIFKSIPVDFAIITKELFPDFTGIWPIISWDDVTRQMEESRISELDESAPHNEAVIILTSGSTSEGKAVVLTYSNLCKNAEGSNANIPLIPGDRWLLSLPLFHVGGLGILFRCMLAGAEVVILDPLLNLSQSIMQYYITHISLVSTQLYRLLEDSKDNGKSDLKNLKAVLLGGSAFSRVLIERAIAGGFPLYTSYGLSEMGSQVTTTAPGNGVEKLLTSGRILPYRNLKIDVNGEICVKGETLFKGYLKNGQIECPLDEEGWFRTRDLGYIDSDRYLHVIGRIDNMFISGGENIIPEEIEKQILQIPGIEQVVVVPVESEEYGYRPIAFLKVTKGLELKVEQVQRYLKAVLPGFKVPDRFYLWPEQLEEKGMKISRAYFRGIVSKPGYVIHPLS